MLGTMGDWIPPANVTIHSGVPLNGTLVFFAHPPQEIGEVISAHSTLVRGKNPSPLPKRIAATMIMVVVGGYLGLVTSPVLLPTNPLLLIFGGALVAGLLGSLATPTPPQYSFLGKEGIARFVWSDEREKREQGAIFLFRDGAELRTTVTRNYVNGSYAGTGYKYVWTRRDGKSPFVIEGAHKSEEGNPPSEHPFHLACVAEYIWSQYRLNQVTVELEQTGSVRFLLNEDNYVVVAPGQLELHLNGQVATCNVAEIDRVVIKQGVVTVRRKDATSGFLGIGAKGVFKFDYSGLSDGRVFMLLLDQLVGVEIS